MSNVGRGSDLCTGTVHRRRSLPDEVARGSDQYTAMRRSVLSEIGKGAGYYEAVARDPHGRVKQIAKFKNTRTLEGYEHMLAAGFAGASQVTQWYLGLKGEGLPSENDTHASHPAWSEITDYNGSTRPVWSPGAVAAATGGGRQIDNFASAAQIVASAPVTVHGAFLTSLPNKGGLSTVTSDDFTGTNGAPPDPAKWTVTTAGIASATIQSNALELSAQEDGGTFGDVLVTGVDSVLDGRIDCDIVVPGPGVEFFCNLRLRLSNGGQDYYRLFIQRTPQAGALVASLAKTTAEAGFENAIGATFNLDNNTTHWNCRFEVTGTGNPLLKGAVRDFASGPIAEGSWDLQEVDDLASPQINAAGPAELSLTETDGIGAVVTVDNFVLSQAGEGIIASVGDFSTPVALVLGGTLDVRARMIEQN